MRERERKCVCVFVCVFDCLKGDMHIVLIRSKLAKTIQEKTYNLYSLWYSSVQYIYGLWY